MTAPLTAHHRNQIVWTARKVAVPYLHIDLNQSPTTYAQWPRNSQLLKAKISTSTVDLGISGARGRVSVLWSAQPLYLEFSPRTLFLRTWNTGWHRRVGGRREAAERGVVGRCIHVPIFVGSQTVHKVRIGNGRDVPCRSIEKREPVTWLKGELDWNRKELECNVPPQMVTKYWVIDCTNGIPERE